MPNKGRVAVCPLEIDHHGKVIICEGIEYGARQLLDFESAQRQRNWRQDFCTDGYYKACPYYQIVMEAKYPEEEAKC